jgi:hypothetical protein
MTWRGEQRSGDAKSKQSHKPAFESKSSVKGTRAYASTESESKPYRISQVASNN